MTDIFAVEIPTGTAGLAVREDLGFRFYASSQVFAVLEGRNYRRLDDIKAEIRRLTVAPRVPSPSPRRGKRGARAAQR